MLEITPENAADYFRETRRVPEGREINVRALGWGVSNVVLRIDVSGEPSFVLKQAREKLRVKAHWVSRLDRIWTEREALTLLDTILPEGTVPRVLFSDEENYLFAMTFAPDDSVVWKEQLLAGKVDSEVGRKAGEILGTIHRATRDHPALKGRLADLSAFDELRIDPFYREIAKVHPEIAPVIDTLILSMNEVDHPCLVLGDFSPKNILVHSQGLTLVDFETAHAGDRAFDLGFFLSHLLLKSHSSFSNDRISAFSKLLDAFGQGYGSRIESPGVRLHTAACGLARIDGKSPVDYLDEEARGSLRTLFLDVLRKVST
jgi:5-methylthioribose kinase